MHRIDTPTAQKDKFGAGKNGFTRGNPQTGTPATDLDDDYCDSIQEELAGIVEASGATLDKADRGQILKALKVLFSTSSDSLGALAALVGAANKLPYFTGPKDAALADLTAFAREILAQTNAAGVLSKLQLGEAAKRGVGTGENQIPDMSAFPSTPNQFQLPTGHIIKFKKITVQTAPDGGSSTMPVTFDTPFPNECLLILGTYMQGIGNGSMEFTCETPTKTGFTFRGAVMQSSSVPFNYLAIGR